MPTFCCAFGCTNSSDKVQCQKDGISFHRFPFSNKSMVNEWLYHIRRVGFIPSEHSRLCSRHFETECFTTELFTGRRLIKPGSIPTIFPIVEEKIKIERTSCETGFADIMPACTAIGCTNRSDGKNSQLTFHRFPKNNARRQAWIKAVNRKNWKPSESSVLCSEHFTEENMDRTSLSTIRVRENAVPTLFHTFPSCTIKYMTKNIRSCEAAFCENNNRNCSLSFFSFPKNDQRRLNKWLSNIEIKASSKTEKFLCSDHFADQSFTNTSRRRLRLVAVPTIQTPEREGLVPCPSLEERSNTVGNPVKKDKSEQNQSSGSVDTISSDCEIVTFEVAAPEKNPRKCDKCGTFLPFIKYYKHRVSCKGNLDKSFLSCPHCHRKFQSLSLYRVHLNTCLKSQTKNLKNKTCNTALREKENEPRENVGLKGRNPILINMPSGYFKQCSSCEQYFQSWAHFRMHLRRKGLCRSKPYVWQTCNHEFVRTFHLLKHETQKPTCSFKPSELPTESEHKVNIAEQNLLKKSNSKNWSDIGGIRIPSGNANDSSIECQNFCFTDIPTELEGNSFEEGNHGMLSNNQEGRKNSLTAECSVASSKYRYLCKTCNEVFLSFFYLQNHFEKNISCHKFKSYKIIDSFKTVIDNTLKQTARKSFPASQSSTPKIIKRENMHLVSSDKSKSNLTCMEKQFSEKSYTGSARKSSHNNFNSVRKCDIDTHDLSCSDFLGEFTNAEALHKDKIKHSKFILDGGFECKWCSTIFSQSDSLNLHIQQEHKDLLGFECVMCSLHYLSQTEALQHVVKIHFIDLAKNFIKECKVPIDQVEEAVKKSAVLEKDDGNLSKVCENNEPRISEGNGHNVGNFYCDVCEISFRKLCGLKSHQQSRLHRNCLINKDQAVFAKVTAVALKDKIFNSIPPQYSKQPDSALNFEQLQCSFCLQTFNGIINFVPHRLSHFCEQNLSEISEENPYRCEICSNVVDHHQKVQWHLLHHLQMGKLNIEPPAALTVGSRRSSENLTSQSHEENLEKSLEILVAKKTFRSRLK